MTMLLPEAWNSWGSHKILHKTELTGILPGKEERKEYIKFLLFFYESRSVPVTCAC